MESESKLWDSVLVKANQPVVDSANGFAAEAHIASSSVVRELELAAIVVQLEPDHEWTG